MQETRYYVNPCLEQSSGLDIKIPEHSLSYLLNEQISPHLSGDIYGSVYIGAAGLAYLHIEIAMQTQPFTPEDTATRRRHLEQAVSILASAINNIHDSHLASFLEGKAGCLALHAVAARYLGDFPTAKRKMSDLCKLWQDDQLLDKSPEGVKQSGKKLRQKRAHTSVSEMPSGECELLYGRAGYLYALLYAHKHCSTPIGVPPQDFHLDTKSTASTIHTTTTSSTSFPASQTSPAKTPPLHTTTAAETSVSLEPSLCVPADLIHAVVSQIIKEGRENGLEPDSPFPLTFFWHDKLYLGAAHGLAGILLILLYVKEMFPFILTSRDWNDISATIDALLHLQTDDGNFLSSIGSRRDDLVQWCHGACGFVPLLVAFARHASDSAVYVTAAERACSLLWERGLLLKGVGLCHGIGGNALAFLSMYRHAKQVVYLERARVFAALGLRLLPHLLRVPDRPYSLFEGVGGLAALLIALQQPDKSYFLGYEL